MNENPSRGSTAPFSSRCLLGKFDQTYHEKSKNTYSAGVERGKSSYQGIAMSYLSFLACEPPRSSWIEIADFFFLCRNNCGLCSTGMKVLSLILYFLGKNHQISDIAYVQICRTNQLFDLILQITCAGQNFSSNLPIPSKLTHDGRLVASVSSHKPPIFCSYKASSF